MKIVTILFISALVGVLEAMPRDITDFFPSAKGNLTKITWAHAINSQKLLDDAFKSNVMMLEADVLLGKLTGNHSTQSLIPIMGHPPSTTSDLSLAEFLQKVQAFNHKYKGTELKKGIKLDFKSIEAFESSHNLLKHNYLQMDYPLWINADILHGPLEAASVPVDPKRFLPLCKKFANATLSLGWTTNYIPNVKIKYTLEQVEEMFDVIKHHSIEQPITVPIRAAFATESFLELKELLFVLPTGSTLTLWHGSNDFVDAESLRTVINSLGVARVFIDLPQELLNILKLED